MKKIALLILIGFLMLSGAFAQDPVAYWSFDDIRVEKKAVKMVRGETYIPKEIFAYVKESVSGTENELNGVYYKVVPGVKGNAALLDGYTAFLELKADLDDDDKLVGDYIPYITKDFTIETWIALGAYPKNQCPILDHRRDESEGYYNGYSLEIDALGRVILKVATKGRNEMAMSDETIPLNQWTHVAASYSMENGLSV